MKTAEEYLPPSWKDLGPAIRAVQMREVHDAPTDNDKWRVWVNDQALSELALGEPLYAKVYARHPDSTIYIDVQSLMESNKAKDFLALVMPQLLKSMGALAYAAVAEAWAVRQQLKKGATLADGGAAREELPESLQDVPGRMDVYLQVFETKEFSRMCVREIIRDSGGNFCGLGDDHTMADGELDGRLVGWLRGDGAEP